MDTSDKYQDLLFTVRERHEESSWMLLEFLVNTNEFNKHINHAIECGLHPEIVHPDLFNYYRDIVAQADGNSINIMRVQEKTKTVIESLRQNFTTSNVDDILVAVHDIIYFKASYGMVQRFDESRPAFLQPTEDGLIMAATRLSDVAESTLTGTTYNNDARQIVRQIREQDGQKKRPVRLRLGLPEYDKTMRLGMGTIIGLIAGYKRGKTRVAINCVVNNLYLAKREKAAMEALSGLGEHLLSMSDDEIRKETMVDNRHWISHAKSLWEAGEEYQEWGIDFIALEKSKSVTMKEIACFIAVDFIRDGRRIYKAINAMNDDEWWKLYYPYPIEQQVVHTGWAVRPLFDPHAGYYFTADKHGSKCLASNISIDLLEDVEGGKLEDFWGLRKVAYELAMSDLELRYAEMFRIYDSTDDGGGVITSQDLEKVLRREQIVYPRFKTALLVLDYYQALWAHGAKTEQEALTLNAKKLPNMAGQFGFCILAPIQQNQVGINETRGGKSMLLDVSPRGGTVVTAALENYMTIHGPFAPANEGEEARYDPAHIYWQISGGRRGQADENVYRVAVHGPTGRILKPAKDSDGNVVYGVDAFNLNFRQMSHY